MNLSLAQNIRLMAGSASLSLGLSGLLNGLFQFGGAGQPLWASLVALALIAAGAWPWLRWRRSQTAATSSDQPARRART